MTTIHQHVDVTSEQVEAFCRRRGIVRFELFGSVLRDDFDENSDIDVLVTFMPGRQTSVSDLLDIEEELRTLFGREVDVIKRHLVEESANWIRRKSILESARLVYAAP